MPEWWRGRFKMIFGKPYDNFVGSLADLFDLVSYFQTKNEKNDVKLKLRTQTLYQLVIVRLVSIIEGYLEHRFITILNEFPYYNKAFYDKQIKISTLYKNEILRGTVINPYLGDIIANQYNYQNIEEINEAYGKILNKDIFDGESKKRMEDILALRHRIVHKHQETRPDIKGLEVFPAVYMFREFPVITIEELNNMRVFITEFVKSVEVRLRQKTFKCWLSGRKRADDSLDYEILKKDYLAFLDNFHYDEKTKTRKAKEVKMIWDLDMRVIGKA
ncbi:MAG: hypothetical protein WC529_00440 [Candidatus Margulisiibacteriota bacterium]